VGILWESTRIKIKDLKDYPDNPRRISKKDFERLVNDLKQDGYHRRILVNNDNTIIGGHARKKALIAAGFQQDDEIEVLKAQRPLDENEFKRLNIRDNLYFGEFNTDILANCFEPEQLLEWGMPPEWLPAPDIEVLESEDEAIEVDTAKPAISKYGDIWILGNHKLMCGDSTNAMQVQDLMKGISPILMVTDPPYGVNYNAKWRNDDLGGVSRAIGLVHNDDKADWTEAYSLFPGDVSYIWHASLYGNVVQTGLEGCGFKAISQIIWAKQHFVISRGDYHWKHEVCLYAVKENKKHNWQGARDQSTVWEIDNNLSQNKNSDNKEETWGHSTQKPIECMLRPILNNSAIGEYIYDPFGGSGTTLIAAEKSNRNCLMMELSPHYCDVIVARWEKLTGDKAILDVNKSDAPFKILNAGNWADGHVKQ
jgi:site-specific DNA-methyltransferase (adenine-specific)